MAQHALGIKVYEAAGVCKVTAVYPGSAADMAGLGINDDLLTLNNIQIKPDYSGTNFTEWCSYFGGRQMKLSVSSNGSVKEIIIDPQPDAYYKIVKIKKLKDAGASEKLNFEMWSANKF
jgi:predicted metalloprotease with PDZ domain